MLRQFSYLSWLIESNEHLWITLLCQELCWVLVTQNQLRPQESSLVEERDRGGSRRLRLLFVHTQPLQVACQSSVSQWTCPNTSRPCSPHFPSSTHDFLLFHRGNWRYLPRTISVSTEPLNLPIAQSTFALPCCFENFPPMKSSSHGLELSFFYSLILPLLSFKKKFSFLCCISGCQEPQGWTCTSFLWRLG